MTNTFAKCHECSALLVDNPDDRRAHLAWHRDTVKKIEAQRQRVGALSSDVLRLVDQVKDFRRTLDNHPITAEPTEITVNDIPDDEIDEYEDDAYAGEPDEDPAANVSLPFTEGTMVNEYPLAIDRDDDLDTRLANATGTVDLT